MAHLQTLKKALISYVTNSAKAVWSAIAYPLSIFSSRSGKLKDYHIYGNTVQDGEPAPENPIPMQSVGDLTVNLFDKDNPNIIKGLVYSSTLQIIYNDLCRLVWIEIEPNTTYTITKLPQSGICALSSVEPTVNGYVDVRYTYTDLGGTQGEYTVTSGENHKYLVVAIAPSSGGTYTEKEMIDSLQIQMGGTATEYEPYNKYRIGVIARGKNILKAPLDVSSWEKKLITSANYSYNLGKILPLNETVTLSFDYTTIPKYFYFLTDDESVATVPYLDTSLNVKYLVIDKVENLKLTFTPKEGKSYYLHSALSANNTSKAVAQAWLDKFTYIQIEYGSEATEYEEYKEPKTFDIYLNEPLRKVPDAEDYIDFEKGVVVRSLKERALTGNEDWYRQFFRVYCFVENSSSDGNKMLCVSNRFAPTSWENLYQNSFLATKKIGIAQQSGGVISITPSQDVPSAEDWKAQLKAWNDEENPLTVIYYVKPTEEKIELPKLPQFKGTTVYEVDTTVKPSGMEICYYE